MTDHLPFNLRPGLVSGPPAGCASGKRSVDLLATGNQM